MNSIQDLDLQTEVNRSKYSKTSLPRFASTPQVKMEANLEVLSLQQYRLSTLPDLEVLQKLRILNLNDNFLKQIDFSALETLIALEVLTIRNNLLQDFQFLDCWKGTMRTLDISQNHIKVLRPEIGEYLNLQQLYIAHNSFLEIPRTLTKLKCITQLKYSLTVFQLDWFKYSDPPAPEIYQTRELVFALFQMLEQVQSSNTITIKATFLSLAYKSFTLKFQTNSQIIFKLHNAIIDEDIGILRALLSEGKKQGVDQINFEGYSPLGLSILEEKYLASRYLIYANADPNGGASQFGGCLNLAVAKLQYYLVFDLIKRGAKVSASDVNGNTVLHYLFCVYQNNETEGQKILDLLLGNGINQNQFSDQGYTPLHLAIHKTYYPLVEHLFKLSLKNKHLAFNFNSKTVKERNTCLHLAVITRQIGLVKLIVSHFPEQIFARNIYNQTPIDFLKNDLTIYKYLKGLQIQLSVKRIISSKNYGFLGNSYGFEIAMDNQSQILAEEQNNTVSLQMKSSIRGSEQGGEIELKSQNRSQTRINEIGRQIPLSPNNLKRLEEKNSLLQQTTQKVSKAIIYKTIKRVCYELDELSAEQVQELLMLRGNLSDILDDYLIIKRYLFGVNKIKNLIDLDRDFKIHWDFQIKNMKSNHFHQKNIGENLGRIITVMIKKVEKQLLDGLCQSMMEEHFILTSFFSIHAGFGLSKFVILQNELLKNHRDPLLHWELLQIRDALIVVNAKYNILNQKVLNLIFTC